MTGVYDCVVIGAGFGGITAARDLVDRGRSVMVLEAASRTGGMVFARPFADREDIQIELGGSFVNPDIQTNLGREIARYGVDVIEEVPIEHAAFLTGGALRSLPVPASELTDLERAMGHIRDASKRISPTMPLSRQPIADLDVSVEEFFAPLELGPATTDLILGLGGMYFGTDARKASVLSLVAQTAGFGHSPLGFITGMTHRFAGGGGALLNRMIEQSDIEVRLDQQVERIEHVADGVSIGIRGGGVVHASTCVVAVPTNVMRHVEFLPELSADKARFLSHNHLGRAYKAVVLARNVPRRPFALGVGKIQAIFLGHEYDDGTCLLMAFGDEDSVVDPHSRDEVETVFREYFPDIEIIAVDSHDWNADPFRDGTYRVDRAGEAVPFLRAMSQPEGRLAFAGTDVDDSVWRSWMEGAVNSGHRAADQVSTLMTGR